MSDPTIHLNEFTFDPRTGQLSGPEGTQAVTGLSARVLLCLIQAAPNTVSPEQLARGAWRLDHVSEDTIAQRIALLRKLFNDDPKSPRVIRTLRGEGYALIASLEPAAPPAPEEPASPSRLRSVLILTVIVALTAAGYGLYDRLGPSAVRDEQQSSITDPLDGLLDRARQRLALHDATATQQAITLLETARERAPEDPRVMTSLAFALTTEATKFEGNRIEEAERLARSAVDAAPDMASGWHALGYTLDAQGRVDEALAAYGESLRLNPDDFAARSSAAFLMAIRGRLYEALRNDVTALTAPGTNLYAELQIARSLCLMGDDVRARAFEARALLLNPDNPVVRAGLAEAALSRSELDRVDQILSASEPSGEALRLSGRAALMRGDREAAQTAFEAAGNSATAERAALAALMGQTADFDALAPDDTWPEGRLRLAEIAAARGEAERAVLLVNAAIDLGWRDAGLIEDSPFLGSLLQSGALAPALARIEREVAAQAARLDRDLEVSAQLDAIIASSG